MYNVCLVCTVKLRGSTGQEASNKTTHEICANPDIFGGMRGGELAANWQLLIDISCMPSSAEMWTSNNSCSLVSATQLLQTGKQVAGVTSGRVAETRLQLPVLCAFTWRTKQHSYRKEDRAMHPIYGCPQKFSESSLRTRLLFQKFVMDFCSDRY